MMRAMEPEDLIIVQKGRRQWSECYKRKRTISNQKIDPKLPKNKGTEFMKFQVLQ